MLGYVHDSTKILDISERFRFICPKGQYLNFRKAKKPIFGHTKKESLVYVQKT